MKTKLKKVHFTSENVLKKEFKVAYKGYDADDVDAFLDLILDDYRSLEEQTENYLKEILSLNEKNEQLKKNINKLIFRIDKIDTDSKSDKKSASDSVSVDLIERFSRIEGIVLGNKDKNKK